MINKSLDMLRYLRACMKGRIFIKPDINMSFQRIGNEQMDSCIICMDYFYHIPELEKRKTVIYSAGIGNQINFELDILRRLGGGRCRVICN